MHICVFNFKLLPMVFKHIVKSTVNCMTGNNEFDIIAKLTFRKYEVLRHHKIIQICSLITLKYWEQIILT